MTMCSVTDCDREVGPHGARGWCPKHYQRWLTHRDPEKAIHRGLWMEGRKGSTGNTWKGDRVGYKGAHERVNQAYGRPESCEFCGRTGPIPGRTRSAYEWALRHDASQVVVNLDGKTFSPVPSDYIRLCHPCHSGYDRLGVPRDFRTHERFA